MIVTIAFSQRFCKILTDIAIGVCDLFIYLFIYFFFFFGGGTCIFGQFCLNPELLPGNNRPKTFAAHFLYRNWGLDTALFFCPNIAHILPECSPYLTLS